MSTPNINIPSSPEVAPLLHLIQKGFAALEKDGVDAAKIKNLFSSTKIMRGDIRENVANLAIIFKTFDEKLDLGVHQMCIDNKVCTTDDNPNECYKKLAAKCIDVVQKIIAPLASEAVSFLLNFPSDFPEVQISLDGKSFHIGNLKPYGWSAFPHFGDLPADKPWGSLVRLLFGKDVRYGTSEEGAAVTHSVNPMHGLLFSVLIHEIMGLAKKLRDEQQKETRRIEKIEKLNEDLSRRVKVLENLIKANRQDK
jgi:hypothetical protein